MQCSLMSMYQPFKKPFNSKWWSSLMRSGSTKGDHERRLKREVTLGLSFGVPSTLRRSDLLNPIWGLENWACHWGWKDSDIAR